jgi:hypothetical protein
LNVKTLFVAVQTNVFAMMLVAMLTIIASIAAKMMLYAKSMEYCEKTDVSCKKY